MTVRLHVISKYENKPLQLNLQRGAVIEVEPAMADFLLRDSPDSFATNGPREKASSKPVADKAVKEPADQPARKAGTRKK